MTKHEQSKGDDVKTSNGLAEAFNLTGKSAEAVGPSEASLDHPAAWQEDYALLGIGELDSQQIHDFRGCRIRQTLPRAPFVAFFDQAEVNAYPSNETSQGGHLVSVLLVDRCDVLSQELTQRVDC